MALRYNIQFAATVVEPKTVIKVPALMRQPAQVSFRALANIDNVVAEVLEHSSVRLEAAVGSGKSTKFPAALARITRTLVIHVVPNPLLAKHLFGYVGRVRENGSVLPIPVELWKHPDQVLPKTGLVFMSAAQLVAFIYDAGGLQAYEGVSIVLDEAHESDAFTHLIRNQALAWGASRLVQMSATFAIAETRRRETVGSVVQATYPASRDPSTWRADEVGMPWSMASLNNHLLVFVDSHSAAKTLREQYLDVGAKVFRLVANMPEEEFSAAMMAVEDRREGMVVLLADYTFRSGFSFDVDTVIDTGLVSYFDGTPGQVRLLKRRMYAFESVQAAGRVGRISSGQARYFRPDLPLERKVCDLEGVEREAASYLSRCLGFKPIGLLKDTLLAEKEFPDGFDVKRALSGCYPLTSHVIDGHGNFRQGVSDVNTPMVGQASKISFERDGKIETSKAGKRDSGVEMSDKSSSVHATQRVDVDSGSVDVPDTASPKGDGVKPPDVADGSEMHDRLAGLFDRQMASWTGASKSASVQELEEGLFYMIVGIGDAVVDKSVTFPDGIQSVRRLFESEANAHKVSALDIDDRVMALGWLQRRYTLAMVEYYAAVALLNKPYGFDHLYKGVAKALFESCTQAKLEARGSLRLMRVLAADDFEICEVPSFDAIIDKRVATLEKAYGLNHKFDDLGNPKDRLEYDKFAGSLLVSEGADSPPTCYLPKSLGYDGTGKSFESQFRHLPGFDNPSSAGGRRKRKVFTEVVSTSVPRSLLWFLPDKPVEVQRRHYDDGTIGQWRAYG